MHCIVASWKEKPTSSRSITVSTSGQRNGFIISPVL